jgi:hypothetical protein
MNLSQHEEGWITIPHENRDSVSEDEISLNLKYHKSWKWLMPVAKDIDALFGKNDEVDDMINRVHNAVLQFDKAILHKAVVEFIKFYNDQNK